MSSELSRIIKQNEIIIALLGRMAFKPEEIRNIVIAKKQNPDDYVNGYNSCDGSKSVSEIAVIAKVSAGTTSPILTEWESIEIIYEIEKPGGKFTGSCFTFRLLDS